MYTFFVSDETLSKPPVPGVLSPGRAPAELMVVDNHVFPRVLVTIAGAFTSGLTGVLAFVMLALEGTHQTGMIYAGLAAFALFTAVAELLTVASFATDRKMVTWLGWAVAPGHAAGASVCGYLLTTIGAGAMTAGLVSFVLAVGMVYAARVGSLRVFEKGERGRVPGVCVGCGYEMGELGRCPECGKRA